MGFVFTMVMTILSGVGMWAITFGCHLRWGKGDYTSTTLSPILVGLTVGIAFFGWADISHILFPETPACSSL